MDIYDLINKKLTEQGKTKTWLSKKIDLSYNSLHTLFSRRSENISFKLMVKIALVLNMDLNEFAKLTVDENIILIEEHSKKLSLNAENITYIVFDSLNEDNKMIALKYMVNLLKVQQFD